MRKIFVAGHRGMVGSAICKQLRKNSNIEIIVKSRRHLDLCDQGAVLSFMKSERPDEVIIAAAKVGGIQANNTFPAEFIYQNLQIQNNIIHSAHLIDVQKLLFLGSSCIYPRLTQQPIKEDMLLTGSLEPTNEPYAVAKISGIIMCDSYNRQYGRDYRSVMPTNLYGPGDNYHPENSHVIPALIRRFHDAKLNNASQVVVWGTGNARREFMFVDDMAKASILVHDANSDLFLNNIKQTRPFINVGTGEDTSIKDLAILIANVVGFEKKIIFDHSKPDGTPKKCLNIEALKDIGFNASTELKQGLEISYADFKNNRQYLRG